MLVLTSTSLGLQLPLAAPSQRRCASASMGIINENSLAGKMWGSVSSGLTDLAKQTGLDEALKGLGGDEDDAAPEAAAAVAGAAAASRSEAAVSDLDARAQTGELTFSDFLTMSKAFTAMDGKIPDQPGMKLNEIQIQETKAKFLKHERIVEVMLDEERADPSLLVEDLKAGASNPGPRLQRLATASQVSEQDVALFVMQFEAMREATARIAAGEDPDEVNESMSAPPGSNRAARRAAKAKKKKAKTKM